LGFKSTTISSCNSWSGNSILIFFGFGIYLDNLLQILQADEMEEIA